MDKSNESNTQPGLWVPFISTGRNYGLIRYIYIITQSNYSPIDSLYVILLLLSTKPICYNRQNPIVWGPFLVLAMQRGCSDLYFFEILIQMKPCSGRWTNRSSHGCLSQTLGENEHNVSCKKLGSVA